MNARAGDIVPLSQATDTAPPVAHSESAALLAVIERAASDPNVDVGKMERLLAMHGEIRQRQAEAQFHEAMSNAQSEMTRISADATNPQTHSKYASYGQLDRHLRPIYTKHGFSLSYDTEPSPTAEHIRVECNVAHTAGFGRQYHIDMPADGKGAKGGDVMTKTHATGAAVTYGMRYLLKMIFNVAIGEEDADGNAPAGPKISDKQAADLRMLLTEVGADERKFLAYVKAESIEAIPAANFDAVCKIAAAKRKRQS